MNIKELENIIKRNAGFFDSEEPSAAHFEKFLKKLDDIQHNAKKERLIRILTHVASAAAVFLLVISIVLLRLQSSDNNLSQQLPAEVLEIENYYQYQIESNLKTLNSNLEKCPVQKQNLQSCFKELDKSFMTIQNDLKENPGDERVLNALINHYQTKLDIMEQMVSITDKNCI
jgi:chromosome segregation ATPase